MNDVCPECGSPRKVLTFEVADYECGTRLFLVKRQLFVSRECIQNQRNKLQEQLAYWKSLLVSFGEMDMEIERSDTPGVIAAYEKAFEAVRELAVELAEQAGLGGKRGQKETPQAK